MSATKYIQVVTHGVSGVQAWTEMAMGMVSAPEKPPHLSLIKKFYCGASNVYSEICVVHCIDGEDNLKATQALFDPKGDFLKGFYESPVMKGREATMNWNNMEVMVEYPAGKGWDDVEEGAVIGVYAHGVPNAAEWAKIFEKAVSEDEGAMHKNSGITKSFGGKMFESDWEVKEGFEGAMVVHVFKSLDDKAKFDKMFDPTAEFFGGMVAAGAAAEPFHSNGNGPIFTIDGV